MNWRFSLFIAVLSLFFISGAKRPQLTVSFHEEGTQEEVPNLAIPYAIGEKMHYFRLAPVISNQHVKWFSPFRGDERGSYGAVFKLNRKGTKVLAAWSRDHQGEYLVAALGRSERNVVIDYVEVDQQVTDGFLVIWKGLNEEDVAHMEKLFERNPYYDDPSEE